jgi:murein tripeptide amidase MpaA
MTYRTAAQIDWVMSLLGAWFPQVCELVELPEPTIEGRAMHALRLRAGGGEDRRSVLIVGGLHARELMNPDAILDLQLDLVVSYLSGTDIVLGNRRVTALEIKVILETLDIWMVPCGNPDGREYVLTRDDLWRKNRRSDPDAACDGVDLNRNFDIVWGVTTPHTSCSPCSAEYLGPEAFSEPETRNIRFLLDTRRIDVFLDVHSFSELVLYPWGHAPSQTSDPSQAFTGLATATCAPLSPSTYREYLSSRDRLRMRTVARQMAEAIHDVRGRAYVPEPGQALYATTGTSADYAYGRHIADPTAHKTYGFAMETGPYLVDYPTSFHPTDPSLVQRDTKAGILALLDRSICAIELIGATLPAGSSAVRSVRRVRDDALASTRSGRAWIALVGRVQTRVLGAVLADERLTRQATALLERAGELLDGDGKVTAADVEHGIAFLDALARAKLPKPVRRDLAEVRAVVERSSGKRPRRLLRRLMRTGPRRHRRRRSG